MAKERLTLYDKYGNVIEYDISAASITIDAEGKQLDIKLTELADTIAAAIKSVTFNGNSPSPDNNGNVNLGQQMQADWDENNPEWPSYIRNKPSLANVATSGDYNDLRNKPTIPEGAQTDSQMSDTSEAPVQNKVIKAYVDAISQRIDTLIGSGNVQGAIDTFNEVVAFLNGIDTDDPTLANQLLALNNAIIALQTSLAGKVDKVTGKGLSTNDYTTAEKNKLAGLRNYDDTDVQTAIRNINDAIDRLTGTSDTTEIIDTMNEVIDFLSGLDNTDSLANELVSIRQQLANKLNAGDAYNKHQVDDLLDAKQDIINDLVTIRNGARLGATAVQTETDPTVPSWAKQPRKPAYTAAEVGALPANTTIPQGTVTAVKVNDGQPVYPNASGVVSLTISASGAQVQTDWNETNTESPAYIQNKPDVAIAISVNQHSYVMNNNHAFVIPDYYTQTEIDTKLSTKQGNITDLEQIRNGAALGSAAYQKPATGIPANDLASGVIPDISGKADKTVIITDIGEVPAVSGTTNSATLTANTFYNIASWDRSSGSDTSYTFAFDPTLGVYAGRFTAWADDMTITWPTSVDVVDADSLEITSGHTYEFNVWLGKCIIKDVTGGE